MVLFIPAVQLQNLCMLHTLLNVTLPGIWGSVWLWGLFRKPKRMWKLAWSDIQLKFHLYGVFIKVYHIFAILLNVICNIGSYYMCVLCLWNILVEEKRSQVGFSSISQHSLWHYKHWQTDLEHLDRHPAVLAVTVRVAVKVFLGGSRRVAGA